MFNYLERMNSVKFLKVFKSGKKYFSPFFRVVVFPGSFAVAVVIPKKKLKKRVARNREKRRVSSLLKEILAQRVVHASYIVFLQKNTADLSYLDLKKELTNILKKTDTI